MQRDVGFVLGHHGVPRQLSLELLPVFRVDQLHDTLVDDVRLTERTEIPPRELFYFENLLFRQPELLRNKSRQYGNACTCVSSL